MIVQPTPRAEAATIIRNVDHAIAAGVLARAFGNDRFRPSYPAALMAFVASNHEEGWRKLDDAPLRNPKTGLPYHLGQTPPEQLILKSVASPNFNERHHPWCGLLSSMHSWGLYNGRYGISDAISIDQRPAAYARRIEQMLGDECARQERLKASLRQDQSMAAWVEPEALFASYKLLEFFDTLSLWWQMTHHELRERALFTHVPASVGEDLTLEITPTGPNSARLSPYPFSYSPLRLECRVRVLFPVQKDGRFRSALASRLERWEQFELTD